MAGKYSRKERRLIEKGIEYANKEWLKRLGNIKNIQGIGPLTLLKIYETLGVHDANPEEQKRLIREAEKRELRRKAKGIGEGGEHSSTESPN